MSDLGFYNAPRCRVQIDAPLFGSTETFVFYHPQVFSLKITFNHHLTPDEATFTIPWQESGIDPRLLKNARIAIWLWDSYNQIENPAEQLRFQGMAVKVKRTNNESASEVEFTCQDYTSMFVRMVPFPSRGMPSWDDDITTIWHKICDNTGWYDPVTNEIHSNVSALRDGIDLRLPDDLKGKTLGSAVPTRFHAISKPTAPPRSNAWAVWMWCLSSLGLISFFEGDRCVVTTSTERYDRDDPPVAVWGHNILSMEEESDCSISQKGVLVKSYNPLTGQVLEAVYPKPSDERLKTKRSVAKRAAKEGRDPSLNEQSADYIEFERHGITDQQTLDIIALNAYKEMSLQELAGKMSTSVTFLETGTGDAVDIFTLRAGDPIRVRVNDDLPELLSQIGTTAGRVQYLKDVMGYSDGVARLVVSSMIDNRITDRTFHIKQLEVSLDQESFMVEIEYFNLIRIEGLDG